MSWLVFRFPRVSRVSPSFPPFPTTSPFEVPDLEPRGFRCQAHDGPRMNLWCQCSLWGGRLGLGYLGYPPGNQHIPWKVHFEDDFPFPQVGYVNFLFFSSHFFQPGLAIFFSRFVFVFKIVFGFEHFFLTHFLDFYPDPWERWFSVTHIFSYFFNWVTRSREKTKVKRDGVKKKRMKTNHPETIHHLGDGYPPII